LQGIPLIEIRGCPSLNDFEGLKNESPFGEVRVNLFSKQFEILRSQQNYLNIQTIVWTNSSTNKQTIYSISE